MFRAIDLHRDCRQRAVLLTVALGVSMLVGCKSTQSQAPLLAPAPTPQYSPSPMPTTQPPPLLLGTNEKTAPPQTPLPEAAQAFRPIVPEQYAVQRPVQTPTPTTTTKPLPLPEVAEIKPAPTESLQPKVDALANKIAELEKKLAEKDEAYRRSLLPTSVSQQQPASPTRPAPPLPSIGVSGVSARVEADKVRISLPDSLLFQTGTLQMRPEAEDALRKVVAEIRAKYPNGSLSVEGHTDNLHVDPTNIVQKHDFASSKAMVVVQYFVKDLLWSPERISTSSFGSGRSVADNSSPEGRAQNNRVDIVVSP